MNMQGETYTIFKNGETGVGGMMAKPEMSKDAPTAWTTYFGVDDADKIAKQVQTLGGKVLHPPTDIPTVGRFAILQDPQGAVFGVLKAEPRA
jgi:predicted enzyme related to lactoylglutathione lyase